MFDGECTLAPASDAACARGFTAMAGSSRPFEAVELELAALWS
jgi:hypothetical protein